MDPLSADTLAVNEARVFNFFAESLSDVLGDDRRGVSRDEFLHVTSVLAHYALVGRGSGDFLPLSQTLRHVFDLFVLDVDTWTDPELMETAAAQTLILTGYFADGMRRRHHLGTYVDWGRSFYGRAASAATGRKRAVLDGMRRHFPEWRDSLERLHGQLQENRYLLDVVKPPDQRIEPTH